MAWYSILPAHLTSIETWIIRFFLLLAVINIAPWVIAILYDLVLYVARRMWHEVPIYGGRAQGNQRPRATSLRDRVRRLSLAEMIGNVGSSPGRVREETRDELRRRQGKGHVRDLSGSIIEEDEDGEDAAT